MARLNSRRRVIRATLPFVLASAAMAADRPARPNPTLTPGATVSVPLARLCEKSYASAVRHVSGRTKAAVYAAYGISRRSHREYEVDHLIPLELGGSNDPKNLWPQPRSGEWSASVKDALEDRLHALVCAARPGITLADAQQGIRTDWIGMYKKIFKTETPPR